MVTMKDLGAGTVLVTHRHTDALYGEQAQEPQSAADDNRVPSPGDLMGGHLK